MKFLKFFQYVYLVIAILFFYDGFTKWNVDRNGAYLSIGLGALAVFVYFFRRRFSKKFENRDNSN